MPLDISHSLFTDFRAAVKRIYGIHINSDIAVWVKDHVSKYNVGDILQILKHQELENNIIYKACFAEILVRQGKAAKWNIGVINNDTFIIDILPEHGNHTTIQFTI